MKYSLINVSARTGNKVSGSWIQDFTGTLKGAKNEARETEKANSNRIDIAVVAALNSSFPDYNLKTDLTEL